MYFFQNTVYIQITFLWHAFLIKKKIKHLYMYFEMMQKWSRKLIFSEEIFFSVDGEIYEDKVCCISLPLLHKFSSIRILNM